MFFRFSQAHHHVQYSTQKSKKSLSHLMASGFWGFPYAYVTERTLFPSKENVQLMSYKVLHGEPVKQ